MVEATRLAGPRDQRSRPEAAADVIAPNLVPRQG